MLHFSSWWFYRKGFVISSLMEKHLLIPENESEIMRVSFERIYFFLRSKRPSMNWLKGF
jgi:hypothetical protein